LFRSFLSFNHLIIFVGFQVDFSVGVLSLKLPFHIVFYPCSSKSFSTVESICPFAMLLVALPGAFKNVTIIKEICSEALFFVLIPLTFVFITVIIVLFPIAISISMMKFAYEDVTIVKFQSAMSMKFPIHPLAYVFQKRGICVDHFSLTVWFAIDQGTLVDISIWIFCLWKLWDYLFHFVELFKFFSFSLPVLFLFLFYLKSCL